RTSRGWRCSRRRSTTASARRMRCWWHSGSDAGMASSGVNSRSSSSSPVSDPAPLLRSPVAFHPTSRSEDSASWSPEERRRTSLGPRLLLLPTCKLGVDGSPCVGTPVLLVDALLPSPTQVVDDGPAKHRRTTQATDLLF